jgi:nitrogen regulatory protein P-II 1
LSFLIFFGKTIDTILEAASNGGGWKIFVSDIQETYRIRTKEKGTDAIK